MKDNELIELAARNNAEWCEILCAAHNASGQFTDNFWVNTKQVPKYYPNFITLKSSVSLDIYSNKIQELMKTHKGSLSIKDSFSNLDLTKLGFTKLFDAQWIAYKNDKVLQTNSNIKFKLIDNEEELKRWEASWNVDENLNLFKQSLLIDNGVQFYGCYEGSEIIAGGIVNVSEKVLGISNVFCNRDDNKAYWSALTNTVRCNKHKGKILVGYEQEDELIDVLNIGYETIGKLSIWHIDK